MGLRGKIARTDQEPILLSKGHYVESNLDSHQEDRGLEQESLLAEG
jgi:hypothetical protein